jgi:hypothetical protein
MNVESRTLSEQILDLWHLSRIVAGNKRYERMLYVKKHLVESNPQLSPKKLWLEIDAATRPFSEV